MDERQLEALEKEQERDHKAVTEAIATAEKRIAGLNPDLKPDILAEQARQIREQTLKDTAERRNRMVAVVTSAVPLSDGQKQRLGAALAKLYGRPMHLNLDVDPDVLGGIRVQVGDEVINGSIADRLEDATRRMAS